MRLVFQKGPFDDKLEDLEKEKTKTERSVEE